MTASQPSPRTALVLGGARSGKSRFAEGLVLRTGLAPVYVATAQSRDGEMAERIALHRARRDDRWTTFDAPLDPAVTIAKAAAPDKVILLDCLTLWLSNLMEAELDPASEGERLAAVLQSAAGPVVVVSNEVGSGIVPMNALARRFADEQGRLNQRIAAASGQVFLVAAGLPLRLKPNPDLEVAL